MDYRLELFSNFTYALDPVNGDQFEQFDDRQVLGGSLAWTQPLDGEGRWQLRTGLELRHDDIAPVGLYLTTARERHDTIREDDVRQTQVGAWAGLETRWTEKFRSEIGMRYDTIDYEVDSDLEANSRLRQRRPREPEAVAGVRPVERDGVLRGRGAGLPRQRHPRRDDRGGPHRRRHAR